MRWWVFLLLPLQLSYVSFSRPSNRKQLWRYLSKLSKESSFTQLCYNLYTISVRYGLAEIINELMTLSRSSDARGLGASVHGIITTVASGVLSFGMWFLPSHIQFTDPIARRTHRIWGSLHWHHFTLTWISSPSLRCWIWPLEILKHNPQLGFLIQVSYEPWAWAWCLLLHSEIWTLVTLIPHNYKIKPSVSF